MRTRVYAHEDIIIREFSGDVFSDMLAVSRKILQCNFVEGTADTQYIPIPFPCVVLFALISNDVAMDAGTEVVVFKNGSATIATVSMGTRSAGDVTEKVFSDDNAFDKGDAIIIENDGNGTSNPLSDCHIVLVLLQTLEVR